MLFVAAQLINNSMFMKQFTKTNNLIIYKANNFGVYKKVKAERLKIQFSKISKQ